MSVPAPTPVLLAMLKAPRTGTVKTRLARELGDLEATAIYRQLVEHQLQAVPPGWRIEIHFSPPDAAAEMHEWLGPRMHYFPQSGVDLGARLTHATAEAFTRGARALVVIGGDCPDLDRNTLHAAASGLQRSDVVLGPTADGGYYLIALRCPRPDLFTSIPWSTAETFSATCARIVNAALTMTILPLKEDVDDRASWERQRSLLSSASGAIGPAPEHL